MLQDSTLTMQPTLMLQDSTLTLGVTISEVVVLRNTLFFLYFKFYILMTALARALAVDHSLPHNVDLVVGVAEVLNVELGAKMRDVWIGHVNPNPSGGF